MSWHQWKPYVSVAQRRLQAAKKMAALRKKGVDIQPVEIDGRKIATTFWGEAWCDHLESFSDFENRLPRGRSYVRNGSVCHLAMKKGKVEAKVSGSEIYNIAVLIKTLPAARWRTVKKKCAGKIGSLLELLRGDLSDHIMEVVTDRKNGLFPLPGEISFECDCPDWAGMCKHIAAVLYGVGARLDNDPAMLFRLRGVNHDELIDADAALGVPTGKGSGGKKLSSDELGDVFGIDLTENDPQKTTKSAPKKATKATKKQTTKTNVTTPRTSNIAKSKTTRKTAPKKATKPKTASRKRKS